MRLFAAMVLLGACGVVARAQGLDETIVMVRHAEKPDPAMGQLSCKGLNRALALPGVLEKYGRPAAIFAPDPAVKVPDGEKVPTYSYLRPLTTIEPYAISLHMPVNAQVGYNELDKLEAALMQPEYAHAYVLVAWEHLQMVKFAKKLLAEYGGDVKSVPPWPNSDYDTVYVFRITADAKGEKHLAFRVDHEGLGLRLPDACPGVQLLPEAGVSATR